MNLKMLMRVRDAKNIVFTTAEGFRFEITENAKGRFNGSFYVADCSHMGDIDRVEQYIRSCGGSIREHYWNGRDGGEAYVLFYANDVRAYANIISAAQRGLEKYLNVIKDWVVSVDTEDYHIVNNNGVLKWEYAGRMKEIMLARKAEAERERQIAKERAIERYKGYIEEVNGEIYYYHRDGSLFNKYPAHEFYDKLYKDYGITPEEMEQCFI